MDSSKFIGLLYLGRISTEDCVDWANNCLNEGKDGEYLRKLASMDKDSLDKSKVFKLVRYCFSDIGFRCHPDEINTKIQEAKKIANQILLKEIDVIEGVHKISEISGEIAFPHSRFLEDWDLLDEGTHPDCLEKGWIFYTTNHEKWLETVMREARKLVFSNFEFDVEELW